MKKVFVFAVTLLFTITVTYAQQSFKVVKTDAEWKKQLTPDAYAVTRKEGTERAYTGKYWDNHEAGIYKCVCCGLDLFSSDRKSTR